jgi:hypothetical protein
VGKYLSALDQDSDSSKLNDVTAALAQLIDHKNQEVGGGKEKKKKKKKKKKIFLRFFFFCFSTFRAHQTSILSLNRFVLLLHVV